MSGERKITAKQILLLLKERYSSSREWVCAAEVQRKTGCSDRRYDFVAMNCFESTGQKIEVVEIKVSKQDLRHELEEAEKHTIIFDEIDYYSLAAPEEIVDMKIIPPKWGVYVVKDGKLVTKRKPIHLHDEFKKTISRTFAASFLRAAVSQNLDRSVLFEEQEKARKEGYEAAKKEFGQLASSIEHLKKTQDENYELRDILRNIGIRGTEEERKIQYDKIRRALRISENIDTRYFRYGIRQLKSYVADAEKEMDKLDQLREEASIQPKEESNGSLDHSEKEEDCI